jgi:hypothetical protein
MVRSGLRQLYHFLPLSLFGWGWWQRVSSAGGGGVLVLVLVVAASDMRRVSVGSL